MTIAKHGLDTICGAYFSKSDLKKLKIKTIKEDERYLVQNSDAGSVFMLGCEEISRKKSSIEQEHDLLQTLHGKNKEKQDQLSLPLLQHSKNDEPWFLFQERLWTMRCYVPGSFFDWRSVVSKTAEAEEAKENDRYNSFCQRAGKELARLHSYSIGVGALNLSLRVDYREACLNRLVVQSANSSISLSRIERFIETAVRYQESQSREKKLPAVLIHGDFHPGNFRLTEQGAAGIIDWDFSRFDSPLFDLLYALFMFAGCFRIGKTSESLLDKNYSEAFLGGYFAAINADINSNSSADNSADIRQSYRQYQKEDEIAFAALALALILIFELEFESKLESKKKTFELAQSKKNQDGLVKSLELLALKQERGDSLIRAYDFS